MPWNVPICNIWDICDTRKNVRRLPTLGSYLPQKPTSCRLDTRNKQREIRFRWLLGNNRRNPSTRALDKHTCRRVLATKHSITEPLSSCSKCTSSMINNLTSWASATSPVLFRVTTSHFSGVVTNIWKTKPTELRIFVSADSRIRLFLDKSISP